MGQSILDLIARLPFELREQVYDEAGPLTQYLHGTQASPMDMPFLQLVAAECFHLDNVALAAALPPSIPLSWELLFAATPAMTGVARRFTRSFSWFHAGLDQQDVFGDRLLLQFRYALEQPPARGAHPRAVARLWHALLDHCVASAQHSAEFAAHLLDCAAALGRLDVVAGLLRRDIPAAPHAAAAAAAVAAAAGCPAPSRQTFDLAGLHGHLHIIRFLCDAGLDANVSIDGAIRGGQLEIARYLRKRYPHLCPQPASIHAAIEFRCLDAVMWLLEDQSLWQHPSFHDVKNWSASFGFVDLLELAISYDVGGPIARWVMDKAASRGHLDVVQLLHFNDVVGCTTRAMSDAAQNGHLHVVEWLHNNRTEGCDLDAMDLAAQNGHLNVVKWLHNNRSEGCTARALIFAAENGHYETFIWLWNTFDNKRPPPSMMVNVARHGHFSIVDFYAARTRGDLSALLEGALQGGHAFLAQWLLGLGRATPNASMMDSIARKVHPECGAWLDEQLTRKSWRSFFGRKI